MSIISVASRIFMEEFGFSSHDIFLLFFCPIFSVIGGFAHVFVLWGDYSKIPDDEKSFIIASHY